MHMKQIRFQDIKKINFLFIESDITMILLIWNFNIYLNFNDVYYICEYYIKYYDH